MFRTVYRLPFTLLGIPVLLDFSFLIILPLLAWVIGNNVALYIQLFDLPVNPGPLTEGWMPYLIGLIAALGLFISVVIHELGHSVVGKSYGLKIKNITLWILGGMAQFEKMPHQPGGEALMAIAGPITSFLIAGACWLAFQAIPSGMAVLQFVLAYLMWMNVILAVFNLIPALPLDGGRVLRSLLALRMPYLKATQISAGVSKLLAVVLGIFAIMSFNIILMAIAFFIYMAVSGESQLAMVAETLNGIRVKDLMTTRVKTVPPDMRVSELMKKMLTDHHLGYPVVDQSGNLAGIVTLSDVQKLGESHEDHGNVPVSQIMSSDLNTIGERNTALEAFHRINQNSFGRLIVVDSSGRLIGIISKTDLIRAIQVQTVGFSLDQPVKISTRREA
ncbi:MAG: site-2 protease family protein [Acidobacteriota bacterium]